MRRITPRFSKLALSVFVVIFALSFISLSGSNGFLKPSVAEAAGPAVDNPGIQKAMEVQGRHSESLMGIPGVVGHGIGVSSDGEAVIKIFAQRAGIPGIPAALEGVPTKVKVTGMVIAYIDTVARFDRPVPIGVSTGHPDITAGTIGCRVKDASGNVYALSNNHVYANENSADIGDNVLQPGPYDGGQDTDYYKIGTLYDYVPILFDGSDNTVDAAIALSSTSELGTSTPGVSGVDGYGTPSSTIASAYVGQEVQKNGRTTGWTQGTVDTINTLVDVCYQTRGPVRCVKLARFVGQIGIIPGTFSAGGDSGSLIVTDDINNNPVGLLFAGGGGYTFANPIGLVLHQNQKWDLTVDSGGPVAPHTDIAVTEVNAPASVVQGDPVDAYVTVQNTGNQDVGSFDVVLEDLTDSSLIGTQTVSSLAAGASTTLTFPWDTSSSSIGDHTLQGSQNFADDNAGNDSNSADVSIDLAFTDIAVTEVNAPASAVVGDTVDVYVTVQNTGNQDVGSFDVVLEDLTAGVIIDTQTVTSLAAEASTTLAFSWDTSGASSGDHTLEGSHNFTDDDGSNDSNSAVVAVNEAGAITLTATGYKVRGRKNVDLEWSGATTTNVDIYRDGALITTTANDGAYTDSTNSVGGGSYTYQVCEAGTATCSNEVTVTF